MQRKTFKTSDGAQLSYISAGEGKPIVMLHGWSQSAEQFKYQIPAFAEHYHAIAEAIGDSLHSPRSRSPPVQILLGWHP